MHHKQKPLLKRIWHFIWEDDSLLSWLVNIVLAFVLIKFIVYPGLGFVLGTTHPVVAVVSGSMEHGLRDGRICGEYPEGYKSGFEGWWSVCGSFYSDWNITDEQFSKYSFKNGFNTGDIIVLTGIKPKDVRVGDVIVFKANKPDPIIHRVINKKDLDGKYYFITKGDHNEALGGVDVNIPEDAVIGKARFRVPLLGYIKIGFVELLNKIGLSNAARVFNAR